MPSVRLLSEKIVSAGLGSVGTIESDLESGVITCFSGRSESDLAGEIILLLNDIGVAGAAFTVAVPEFNVVLRIGLVAGDTIQMLTTVAEVSYQITANVRIT